MRLFGIEKVRCYDVEKWLFDNIPELTQYQKQKIRENRVIDDAPFYFMSETKSVNNVLIRLSIFLLLPVLILLIIGLPINFLFTGRWGYSEKMRWFGKWTHACGL